MDHPSGNLRNQLGKPQGWFSRSLNGGGTPTKVDTLQINCEHVHSGEQWRKLSGGKTQTTGYVPKGEDHGNYFTMTPSTLNSYTLLISPTHKETAKTKC